MQTIINNWQMILWILGAYFAGLICNWIIFGPRAEKDAVGVKVYKNKDNPDLIDRIEYFFNEEMFDEDMRISLNEGKEEIEKELQKQPMKAELEIIYLDKNCLDEECGCQMCERGKRDE